MKLIFTFVALLSLFISTKGPEKSLDVAAAASLRESVSDIAARFENEHHVKVNLTFNASGTLATQIEHGAPADVFISAANEQVQQLEHVDLVLDASRKIVAGNQMVLIAPPGSKITSFEDLKSKSVEHVAIGQPDSVPAGKYAAQTFRSLGIYDEVEGKLLFATNVRQVLEYVTRGDVDAGMVYLSDARSAGESVKICAMASPDSHDPIEYAAVVIKTSDTPDLSRAFIEMMCDDAARSVFESSGFTVPTTQQSDHSSE